MQVQHPNHYTTGPNYYWLLLLLLLLLGGNVFSFRPYTVKKIGISTDILWRVFHILPEPIPYTFVSVNRRNNEARAHTAVLTYGPQRRHTARLAALASS